jgi:hypothetical protein
MSKCALWPETHEARRRCRVGLSRSQICPKYLSKIKTKTNSVEAQKMTNKFQMVSDKRELTTKNASLRTQLESGNRIFMLFLIYYMAPLAAEIDSPIRHYDRTRRKTLITSKRFKTSRKHALTTEIKPWSAYQMTTLYSICI